MVQFLVQLFSTILVHGTNELIYKTEIDSQT